MELKKLNRESPRKGEKGGTHGLSKIRPGPHLAIVHTQGILRPSATVEEEEGLKDKRRGQKLVYHRRRDVSNNKRRSGSTCGSGAKRCVADRRIGATKTLAELDFGMKIRNPADRQEVDIFYKRIARAGKRPGLTTGEARDVRSFKKCALTEGT